MTNDAKARVYQAEIDLHKKNEEKDALVQRINKLKNKIAYNDNQHRQEVKTIKEKHHQEVFMIREKIRAIDKNGEGQITTMREEGNRIKEYISDAAKEVNSLEEDLKGYNNLIDGLQNPIIEIERINLKLKLNRSPLMQLN